MGGVFDTQTLNDAVGESDTVADGLRETLALSERTGDALSLGDEEIDKLNVMVAATEPVGDADRRLLTDGERETERDSVTLGVFDGLPTVVTLCERAPVMDRTNGLCDDAVVAL